MNGAIINRMTNILAKFKKVDTLIFDVDGVFTDSSLLVTEEGHLLRIMNARDGYALRHAIDQGYTIIIITGGNSAGVKTRLEGLGAKHVYTAVKDKWKLCQELMQKGLIDPSSSIYMGDDIPDLELMQHFPLTACPQDAAPEISDISDYISPFKGGKGAVRDLVKSILKVQDKWL